MSEASVEGMAMEELRDPRVVAAELLGDDWQGTPEELRSLVATCVINYRSINGEEPTCLDDMMYVEM